MLAALHGDALRTSPTIGVKEGDGVQLDISVSAGKSREYAQSMNIEGAVREHHSLGCARAAAGVEDFGDFIFIKRENIGTRNAVASQKVFQVQIRLWNRLINRDIAPNTGASFAQLPNQRGKLAFENQHRGVGVTENGGQLGGLQPHIERHRDGPNQRGAVVAFQKLMIVEAEIGDTVARADSL